MKKVKLAYYMVMEFQITKFDSLLLHNILGVYLSTFCHLERKLLKK